MLYNYQLTIYYKAQNESVMFVFTLFHNCNLNFHQTRTWHLYGKKDLNIVSIDLLHWT